MVSIVRNEVIKLITVTGSVKNANGFATEEQVEECEVFAEVKSVGRTEYYEALRAGVKTSLIFDVYSYDFDMGCVAGEGKMYRPSKVVHDGVEYRIVRTYRKSMDSMELTCEEVG